MHYSSALATVLKLCAYQYALPTILGAQWEIEGELIYPNGATPHTWGTNLHTIPQHMLYK